MYVETQEEEPEIKIPLPRVGITNLRTIAKINWKGRIYTFIPTFEVTIDLPREKKGIHMSRLVESITDAMSEAVEEEVKKIHTSLEELALAVIKRLEEKHKHKRAEVWIRTTLILEKTTPASRKLSYEPYDVEVAVIKEGKDVKKRLKVRVIGNTACPHAMANNNGKTHIQRAIGELEVMADFNEEIALEDMIEVVESSFSSPTYTLLKTPDENAVVRKMYENPKFVEDVAREILMKAREKFPGRIHVRVISNESIHKHDVIAEAWA
ncbi:GTP cyclohydrolase IV [Pyrococcus abyssi]|uniref:GTP cyclohydrolase MptA n=1 Tax=Pyrococcus abyssi (strain GE5 / Orsay) TaxID=272844 RepID=MPTA_PYRAB|nr:GTP cyclohydrolase IV [Pyrococcus abyssi]Q9V1S9.2 RecName: Full=GTP cyclohydrolase MptA; AltName: Full=GTP cyclohydrolase IV [Pyrococcus abyssi GE5]CCE69725.1 TPA: GTP cyclohydrolase [Pyrococcus abyssi GE5]